MKWESRRGFTLVELLLVLVLLSVVAGTAFPNLRRVWRRALADETARTAVQFLRYAQYRALTEGESVIVTADAGKNRYQLMKYSGPDHASKLEPVAGEWGRPVEIKDPMKIDSHSDRIIFFPDGTSSGGALKLRADQDTIRIGVRPGLGQVDVQVKTQKF